MTAVALDQIRNLTAQIVNETPVLDIHTHLYAAPFGDLLLWGPDELVTYHYLIAEVSRKVSELLDEPPLSDELPGPFVLEVTSPGVDRPLTEPRHWRRAISRLVDVTRTDDSVVEGRVVSVPSEDEVVLLTDAGETSLRLAEVRRAVVQVEFNRVDAIDDPGDDVADTDEEGE